MRGHFRSGLLLVTALALASLVVVPALAQQSTPPSATTGRTPVPVIPKAKGEACVAPAEWMRRNHMTALIHRRDETMYEGARGPRFSLKECLSCHAVAGADGQPVKVSDPKHFCRTCHDYAAVRVDCFECHASRPEPPKSAGIAPAGESHASEVAAMRHYLGEASR